MEVTMDHSVFVSNPDKLPDYREFSKKIFSSVVVIAGIFFVMSSLFVQPLFASVEAHVQYPNNITPAQTSKKGVRVEDVDIKTIAEDKAPAFDEKTAKYVLLSWSDKGMKSYSDASDTWMIHPPGVNLNAQLIKRGKKPQVVMDEVNISYAIDKEFTNPASQVNFWKNTKALYNREIAPNTGLTGNSLSGTMKAGDDGRFVAEMVPVVPYTTDGKYMPYPAFTITATDDKGRELAITRVVTPVATEMGCQECHGGTWKKENRAGMAADTAENVLAAHDKISGTKLQAMADSNKPVLCNSCHADPSQGASGNDKQLNLSAAIHGFHANFLGDRGALYCVRCHPAQSGGATRAFRDIHRELGLNCTYCHGEIEDLAISLLKAELANGKQRAKVLLEKINPSNFSSADEIEPREPWVNEPDCLNCHVNFQKPESDTTFNKWTAGEKGLYRNRTDKSGRLFCAACHGSPHAVYPAINPYSINRDVLQPLQYQNEPFPIGSNRNCKVCHIVDMQEEMHHPNILREFRNR
jgi:hypothetical protein